MSELVDPWHFPRPELARGYLHGFDLGLTSARGLFARRRMGKSEFLKHDLLPAAVHAGYLAAYTNLWDATDHPGQALATGPYVIRWISGNTILATSPSRSSGECDAEHHDAEVQVSLTRNACFVIVGLKRPRLSLHG